MLILKTVKSKACKATVQKLMKPISNNMKKHKKTFFPWGGPVVKNLSLVQEDPRATKPLNHSY